MTQPGSPLKNRPKIVIIEDSVDDVALLMRQLKKAEMHEHVHTIRDGREALDFFRHGQGGLSAVFLDLNLPRVGGLQLLEFIRKDERTREVPVIVMTSSNLSEDLERCRELGVSCYIQKPLTFSSFAKAFADTFHATANGNSTRRTD